MDDLRLRYFGRSQLARIREALEVCDLDPACAEPRGEAGLYGASILDRAAMRGEAIDAERVIAGIDWERA